MENTKENTIKPNESLTRRGVLLGTILLSFTLVPSLILVFQNLLYLQEKKDLAKRVIEYDQFFHLKFFHFFA